jgi:hypothetical protein
MEHESHDGAALADLRPSRSQLVEIVVNTTRVRVPERVTGSAIKAAANIPADFELYRVRGRSEVLIENDREIKVREGERFTASPALDYSYVAVGPHAEAMTSVTDAFADYVVDMHEPGDGSTYVIIRAIELNSGWNRSEIDLEVRLTPAFPSTAPYPYYAPAGLARSDGKALPLQQVQLDGETRTQISLRKDFDATSETLGARLRWVVAWLEAPR